MFVRPCRSPRLCALVPRVRCRRYSKGLVGGNASLSLLLLAASFPCRFSCLPLLLPAGCGAGRCSSNRPVLSSTVLSRTRGVFFGPVSRFNIARHGGPPCCNARVLGTFMASLVSHLTVSSGLDGAADPAPKGPEGLWPRPSSLVAYRAPVRLRDTSLSAGTSLWSILASGPETPSAAPRCPLDPWRQVDVVVSRGCGAWHVFVFLLLDGPLNRR